MNNNTTEQETKEVNLHELSPQQLDQLAVNFSIQIAQTELTKQNLLQSLTAVLQMVEEKSKQTITLPKLKKPEAPDIKQ